MFPSTQLQSRSGFQLNGAVCLVRTLEHPTNRLEWALSVDGQSASCMLFVKNLISDVVSHVQIVQLRCFTTYHQSLVPRSTLQLCKFQMLKL